MAAVIQWTYPAVRRAHHQGVIAYRRHKTEVKRDRQLLRVILKRFRFESLIRHTHK